MLGKWRQGKQVPDMALVHELVHHSVAPLQCNPNCRGPISLSLSLSLLSQVLLQISATTALSAAVQTLPKFLGTHINDIVLRVSAGLEYTRF